MVDHRIPSTRLGLSGGAGGPSADANALGGGFLRVAIVLCLGMAVVATVTGCDTTKRPVTPFVNPGWYDDIGTSLLLYRAEQQRLPTSEEGLQVLTGRRPFVDDERLFDSYTRDLDGKRLLYHCGPSNTEFRITSRGGDRELGTDDDSSVHGTVFGDGLLLMRTMRGCQSDCQPRRPAEELAFLMSVQSRLLPALERYYDDHGRYPSFLDWTPIVAGRSSWHEGYLDQLDAVACMRGPFEQPISYGDIQDGAGFSIFVSGPRDLIQSDGDLVIIRLRAKD